MSSTNRRDTIQISLGPSANAVTSHLLNLQGLAATTSMLDDAPAICDIGTTHSLDQNFWVPRFLMVDEPTRFVAKQDQRPIDQEIHPAAFWDPNRMELLQPTWSRQYHVPQRQNFMNISSTLAYSSYSRFYQEPQQHASYSSSSNGRHVNWDEDGDDEEEEHPDDRRRRQEHDMLQWKTHSQEPLQEQLATLWNQTVPDSDSHPTPNAHQRDKFEASLSWVDYLMPPYSETKSLIALPYSGQSHIVAHWDSFAQATSPVEQGWKNWREDELSERLRQLLEESDYCQGFMLTTESFGFYAGLATSVLHELQEECKSAGRLVFHVVSDPFAAKKQSLSGGPDETNSPDENVSPSSTPSAPTPTWQPANVERVRRKVQSGLALASLTQNAHVTLPLRLHNHGDSLFRASARIAMALESLTLPFRLRPTSEDSRYKIGLQNTPFFGHGGGSDDAYFRWGTTAQRLSFGEFLTGLQPSSQYKLVEMDMMTPTDPSGASRSSLLESITEGTSVERDQRMRDSGRDARRFRSRDVLPGGWLQDVKHGGLLSSMSTSYPTLAAADRSLHHHFALATAIRPNTPMREPAVIGSSHNMSQYLTCVVEGMGIRYRPERSMCTVVNQSFAQLMTGGYGTGTYWEAILAAENGNSGSNPPCLAVLGNTTRIYPHLDEIAANFKSVLGRSSQLRGLYNRDVMNGVLPEVEDCEEALAACYDIRDVYQPPDASGLAAANESSVYDDVY